tara:strand:- start:1026 stop:1208 length:183 start_codon:yes stop_codon:yes gene_type:complete
MNKSVAKLSEEIKGSKVKQTNLAKIIGVSPEHLNAMLNGRLKMNKNMYSRIKYWYEKVKA